MTPHAKPPPEEEDATPFLLRVYFKTAPFRPLDEFNAKNRPDQDEFKIYVWLVHLYLSAMVVEKEIELVGKLEAVACSPPI